MLIKISIMHYTRRNKSQYYNTILNMRVVGCSGPITILYFTHKFRLVSIFFLTLTKYDFTRFRVKIVLQESYLNFLIFNSIVNYFRMNR